MIIIVKTTVKPAIAVDIYEKNVNAVLIALKCANSISLSFQKDEREFWRIKAACSVSVIRGRCSQMNKTTDHIFGEYGPRPSMQVSGQNAILRSNHNFSTIRTNESFCTKSDLFLSLTY